MGTENLKNSAYPFDQGWRSDTDWQADSTGNRDLSWTPDRDQIEMPKPKPSNGGASFAAWEKKTKAEPELTNWPPADMLKTPEPLPPGFYVVPRSMTGKQVLAKLFADTPHSHLVSRIKSLNPTFDQGFKAGEMVVLGNLLNPAACLREEAELMLAAAEVRAALEPLSDDEANFMAEHHAEIASVVDGASQSLGLSNDVLSKALKDIESTLRDLEYLHQREFVTHGHLRSPQFFATHQQLYRQLDSQLKATFLGKQLGLGSYPTLRRDLGISTQSLVHHWSKGGAPGQIPGYATHMAELSKAAKFLKAGGYIGLALGGTASSLKIQEVCQAGDTKACQKIRFTETGSFAGSLAGGALGGMVLGGSTTGAICAALGIPSAGVGTLACGLVVVGVGSLVAGSMGGYFGEGAAEVIYERTNK